MEFRNNVLEKIFSFKWFRNNSDNYKAHASNKGAGNSIALSGIGNKVEFGTNLKQVSESILKSAIAELNHNSKPAIGDSKAQFKSSNLEKVLSLPSEYEVSKEIRDLVDTYLTDVTKCNANRGVPGHVQQRSKILKVILEEHLDSLIKEKK